MTRPRIPLTRPLFPKGHDFFVRWSHVTQMTGQHSNFGPLWEEAARRLEYVAGGAYKAFPVSNGTDAVALAIHGTAAETPYEPEVYVEAFTFAASFCAAQMVAGPAVGVLATDEPVDPTSIAVRTKWWGYERDLTKSGPNDVIDAAGGFGDKTAFRSIGRDSLVAVSFHATKNFPIGEGGAVLVPKHREKAAAAVRRAMAFGFDDQRRRSGWGTNAKLDELRCSLLITQLEHAPAFRQRSAFISEVATGFSDYLRRFGVVHEMPARPGPWPSLPVVAVREARALVAYLEVHGFQCRVTYDPIDGFDDYEPWQRECVALPADMTPEEQHELAELLERFYAATKETAHAS